MIVGRRLCSFRKSSSGMAEKDGWNEIKEEYVSVGDGGDERLCEKSLKRGDDLMQRAEIASAAGRIRRRSSQICLGLCMGCCRGLGWRRLIAQVWSGGLDFPTTEN